MKLIDIVRQASAQTRATKDGDPAPLVFDPPLDDADMHALEAQLPCPIPPDVTELLSFCSGFSGGAVDVVDFTGRQCLFEFEAAFPHGLPIAADGYGNFWVVDLLPESKTFGEFLSELFRLSMLPYKSLVDDVRRDRLFDVWRKNPKARTLIQDHRRIVTGEIDRSPDDAVHEAGLKEQP